MTTPPSIPKRIFVTGASGAVGFATCKELVTRGHRVAGTIADAIGAAESVAGYNEHLAQVTQGIYNAFGNRDMLRLDAEGT